MMDDTSITAPVPDTTDDGEPIECPVAKWYYKRMGLMFLMLFAMACWFLYDAATGYPKKKDVWEQYVAMTGYDLQLAPEMTSPEQLPSSGTHLVIVGKGESGYHFRVFDGESQQSVDTGSNADSIDDTQLEKLADTLDGKWTQTELSAEEEQEILGAVSTVTNVNLKGAQKSSERMEEWRLLAKDKGWELEPEEYTQSKIDTQWQFTLIMLAASLVAVVVFLFNKGKVLRADAEAFYTAGGKRVAFADVFRIDRRKWDHKGLAYAMYRLGGEGNSRKATIDDLKFVGAGKILNRLLSNFEGELIDRVPDDDDDEDEEEREQSQERSKNETETVDNQPISASNAKIGDSTDDGAKS